MQVEKEAKGVATQCLETDFVYPALRAVCRDRLSEADLQTLARVHILCQSSKDRQIFKETYAVLKVRRS